MRDRARGSQAPTTSPLPSPPLIAPAVPSYEVRFSHLGVIRLHALVTPS